ncbi:malonyl-CoA:anthocyanidin 5-O-glucoside-6''-O-malonyltransferase [Ricinus communis]|uniref:Anthocyanin 5-aromatic acyltransferase, putative n=1 Tax=Ricinus communis TaxID=3988 RepID=B9SNQ4_RICCO|nr:malonyl-CoA:anthocyanidin 5-O-glucoside-6''-O-malonyltransferase [Ricinus communis]EEF34762.1 Anthocyanin 5-aromatic acyltransferase, putative [Ricinus communis]|eukprot:XP_002527623.1 malonyl-CoA:anthocyanidin 5-O-glucoside-6''-O-malonyltransferase [Ricinus communis]
MAKIFEVARVTPSTHSPESATELSLPLTFFDVYWLKFHPVERLFFYQHTDLTLTFFNSVLVPKLKQSLSHALLHYLPFAGSITWPEDQHAPKPFILYTPNDGVSVTVAESYQDFFHLSGNQIRKTIESSAYVPELPVSDSKAATIAFQITLFPNQGFAIGVSSHHAIFDGKSVTMFMKAWAYICKQSQENDKIPCVLPEELTPFLDRTVVRDPYGLDMIYLNNWSEAKLPGLNANNHRSLKLYQAKEFVANSVRATFKLNLEDIKKLKQKIVSQLNDPDYIKSMHLSRFVVSYAYILLCIVKARKPEKGTMVIFVVISDCRSRLDPPIPASYFGNCVNGYPIFTQAEPILSENGLAFVAKKLSERIKGLEKEAVISEGLKNNLAGYIKAMERESSVGEAIAVGVAGSPKFEVYGTDFGWGKPDKVEISSLGNGSMSMAESRDGNGGFEIGMVLRNHDEMEMFDSIFVDGLKDLH